MKPQRINRNREIWQVIYIDLLSNLMCFFVILWSINQGRKVQITESLGDHTSRVVSLPGDVIFPPGKNALSEEGKGVFQKLFSDSTGNILRFDQNALMKRMLVIHGHTDGDGKKDENLQLGFERAMASYHEIAKYSAEVPEHVVLCTHANNSPVQDVPQLKGKLTPLQREVLATAKAKNRRIQIEDNLVSKAQIE